MEAIGSNRELQTLNLALKQILINIKEENLHLRFMKICSRTKDGQFQILTLLSVSIKTGYCYHGDHGHA